MHHTGASIGACVVSPDPECMGVLMQDINLVLLPVLRQVLVICILGPTVLREVKTLNPYHEAVDANSPSALTPDLDWMTSISHLALISRGATLPFRLLSICRHASTPVHYTRHTHRHIDAIVDCLLDSFTRRPLDRQRQYSSPPPASRSRTISQSSQHRSHPFQRPHSTD
jgi:hypothetical protein